jgi:hypothetical protein
MIYIGLFTMLMVNTSNICSLCKYCRLERKCDQPTFKLFLCVYTVT